MAGRGPHQIASERPLQSVATGAISSPALDPDCDTPLETRVLTPGFSHSGTGASIAHCRRLGRGASLRPCSAMLRHINRTADDEDEGHPRAHRAGRGDSGGRVERRRTPLERGGSRRGVASAADAADNPVEARRRADFAAMQTFRPGYAFWQHVFTSPDHSIAFGSAVDGRLLATFPAKGAWTREAVWIDPSVARILDGQRLARKLSERRQQVALLLEGAAGPVLHNSTRGDALLANARRYGPSSRSGARFTSGSACPPRSVWRKSSSNRA